MSVYTVCVCVCVCERDRPTLVFWTCRFPCSSRTKRGSVPSSLAPSFSQDTEGSGSPDARHRSSDTPPTACVWLDGPWRMMGGGRSFSAGEESREWEIQSSDWITSTHTHIHVKKKIGRAHV